MKAFKAFKLIFILIQLFEMHGTERVNTITKSLPFRMEYIMVGGFDHIITLLSQCVNEVIHFFIT